MKQYALRYFLIGQLVLYVCLGICIAIIPSGALANIGISFYGVHFSTLLPYVIGLVGSALFGLLAAWQIDTTPPYYRLRYGLIALAILECGVAFTPYDGGQIIYDFHTSFGSLLFAFQLLITGLLAFSWLRRWFLIAAWSLQFITGVVSGYYLIEPSGYLFLSQLSFQLCFGGIMLYTLAHLPASEQSTS